MQKTNLLLAIALPILIAVGLFCNSVAIWFLWWKRSSKASLKDKIVTNLCAINILQQLGGFTIELDAAIKGAIGDPNCQITGFIVCSGTYASIGCFIILVLERYMSIVYPFKSIKWFKIACVRFCFLSFPTLFGLLFGIPPLLGWNGYKMSQETGTFCSLDFQNKSRHSRSYFYTVIVFTFAGPLFLTIACFTHIIYELRRNYKVQTRRSGRGSNISRDSKRSVNGQYVSSILTGMIYIISWSPYAVVCFLFNHDVKVSLSFELWASIVAKTSTVSSPIVFCLVEKRFRRFLMKRRRNRDVLKRCIPNDTEMRMMEF